MGDGAEGAGMDSKDEEKRIAMTLARRAYLYGAFHVVFGGGVA